MKILTANEAFEKTEDSIFESELRAIATTIDSEILCQRKQLILGKDEISEKAKQLLIENGYSVSPHAFEKQNIIISWDKPKRSLKESVEFTVETICDEINALIVYSDELEKASKDNRCEQAKIKAYYKAIDIITENIKY